MLTPESTEKLVCIIGVAGVFVGELVRKQAAAAYSHVLATAMFMIQYTTFPWKITVLCLPIAYPIPLKVILHGTIRNDDFGATQRCNAGTML